MPASNPLEILLAHNHWANRQLIDACAKLTPEQFHQRFEMGPGSLHDTLAHILSAMRSWTDMLVGRERRPPLLDGGRKLTTTELAAILEEASAEFSAVALAHPLDPSVSGVRGGKTYTFTRGAVLTHVTTHGLHHRAQALNMLRQLGVTPLPPSSVLEWLILVDAPPT